MGRRFLVLLYGAMACGQVPALDPFERAMQASQQARNQGNPAAAAEGREEAHKLLDLMPAGSQQWAGRVQRLAQSYQGAGRHVQARAVVQDALARATALPEWHPSRVQLLNTLAEFWEQDGNLLKALSYREKAVTGVETTPPGASAESPRAQASGVQTTIAVMGRLGAVIDNRLVLGMAGGNNNYLYDQLANLYRQLGRPEDVAKTIAKMRSRMQNDLGALANSYAQEGDFDQAVALYRKQAEAAAAKPQAQPWEIAGPLQSIASLDEQQERWADAAAALEQAATRLDSSGEPGARNASSIRLRLANLLERAGQGQSAEELYQSLLQQAANDQPGQALPIVQQYAQYLANTGRASQGAQLLKDFQANHSDLDPWQESNILMSLAHIARNHGEKDLADQYQRAAMEKQRIAQAPQGAPRQVIGPRMQQAQKAVSEGNLDEAVNLALDAIASAATAPDGEQIAWQAPNVAAQMAGRQAAEKGEQIYRALFPVLEARAVDNLGPLNQALQQYARFLMGQKNRWGDAALAIERYRDSVAASQSLESDGIVQVQHLRIELAQNKGASEEAGQRAEELLTLEETLSGATSTRYMNAAQRAASVYQSSGKKQRALALHRQIVAIADLTFRPNDAEHGYVRMNAAMAFAMARQFDEAERLANEAVTIGMSMKPSQADRFRAQGEQIQKMRANASGSGAAGQPRTSVVVTPSGQRVVRDPWFSVSERKPADSPRP